MTNPNTITLKTIAGLLEAIDIDDKADADLAIKQIKALIAATEKPEK